MLASCTTSLSYVNLFQRTLSFSLPTDYDCFSVCFRYRSFLKADAKVQLFLIPCKTLAKKNAIFIQILTPVHILSRILWAHTLFLLRVSAQVKERTTIEKLANTYIRQRADFGGIQKMIGMFLGYFGEIQGGYAGLARRLRRCSHGSKNEHK